MSKAVPTDRNATPSKASSREAEEVEVDVVPTYSCINKK